MRAKVERHDIGGIPVFGTSEGLGSPVVGMSFRVGKVDEYATISGVSHLVEHLALPAHTLHTYDFNGSVEPFVTSFWATGEIHDVHEFIASTARLLTDLPLARFDVERRTLMAEDAIRSEGGARAAFRLRFGPVDVGLIGYEEYGLKRLEPDDVRAWCAEHFTVDNVSLWAVGVPADAIELRLPRGMRKSPPPEPRQLSDLTTPALYASGWGTGFCLSFIAARSRATVLSADLLVDALRERVRYERGLSYSIDSSTQVLAADVMHLVITADVADDRADEWLASALDVLDSLGSEGSSEERLEIAKARNRRYESEPGDVFGFSAWCADQELLGLPFRSKDELAAEREAITTEDIAATVAAFGRTLLVLGPESASVPDGLVDYPYTSRDRVDGRAHRPRGLASRLGKHGPRLVAGQDGISIVRPDGTSVTARYERTVLCVRRGNTRTLLTDDGFYLPVDPTEWAGGSSVVAAVDAAIPADRVISDDPTADAKRDHVEEFARATFQRTWLLSDELEVLPDLLEDGEVLLLLASASRGWRHGLIVLTDRRFRFLYGKASAHSFTVEGTAEVRSSGSKLEVMVDDRWLSLTDVAPKGRAEELERLLQR